LLAAFPCHRSDHDDRARSSLEHRRQERSCTQEHTGDVHGERRLPILAFEFPERPRGTSDATIGDQCIDPAEPFQRPMRELTHLRVIGDVGRHAQRSWPDPGEDRRGRVETRDIPPGEHDVGA
jgi:hypothetical protein